MRLDSAEREDGRLRLVVVDDARDDWETAERLLQDEVGQRRVFGCRWETVPDLNGILDNLIRCLGRALLDIWPEWYGSTWRFQERESLMEVALAINLFLRGLSSSHSQVIGTWLQEAARLATAGKLPLPEGTPRALQVGQLSLALDARHLTIMLGSSQANGPQARSLMAAAEWLMRESRVMVAVVVSAADRDLDAIQRLPHTLLDLTRRPSESVRQPVPLTSANPVHSLSPPLGRPHPFSPGEQLLYSRLSKDSELGALMSYNQLVEVGDFAQCRVDLLWREGKVIVEVDGLRDHLNRYAFVRDRERDFNLLVHGYLVLRLPHDQVIEDVELAIAKIRRVVQLRQL